MKLIITLILGAAVLILAALLLLQRKRHRTTRRNTYVDALYALIDGRRDLALQLLMTAVRNGENDIDAYLQLGNLLREFEKPEKALQIHRGLAVRRDLDSDAEKRIQLAIAEDLGALGRTEKAIQVLEAVHQRRKDPEVIRTLHTLHHRSGSYDRAHALLKELSRLDGDVSGRERAAYLATVASILHAGGSSDEAKKYLAKAEREDNGSPPALYLAGAIALEEQDMKLAAKMWERLLYRDIASFPDVLPMLEKALYQSGRFAELENLLLDLIEKNPGRPALVGELASFYEKKGEIPRAIEILEAEQESTDLGPIVSARLASLYVQADRCDNARDLLEEIDVSMKHPSWYYCSACGSRSDVPLGYCGECSRFNSFVKSHEKIPD